jgi:5-formyltetrahydrofolate cyclo-ligase
LQASQKNQGPSAVRQDELRQRLLRERKKLSAQDREAFSSRIRLLLEDLFRVRRPRRVATFLSVQNEPDLQLEPRGFNLCYPRVNGERLDFYETALTPDQFEKSPLSVMEPPLAQSRRVELGAEDVVLVPGVVFNFKGHRIGMGKGYYDRFLATSKASPWGIGYGFQLLADDWSSQPWDKNMQLFVGENFALNY